MTETQNTTSISPQKREQNSNQSLAFAQPEDKRARYMRILRGGDIV